MVSPAKPPDHHRPPTPSPIIQPLVVHQSSPSSKLPIDFSPPLIAMVVIAAAAFLFVTYSRLLSRLLFRPFLRLLRRRPRPRPSLPSFSTFESPPYDPSDGFFVYSPYGLDESVIKTIPLTIYNSKLSLDCAVCLLEFEEEDYIRTLPICSHSFHVDCIDMWLRSHASCPLCRAGVVPAGSPLAPIMAGRIRPSLDEEGLLLENILLQYLPEGPSPEITPAVDDQIQTEDRNVRRDFVLKRSYSFGFERSFPSERLLVTEPVTASPWRGHRRGGFWSSKRPSPFGSVTKSRVFSFRYKGVKSPFFRRRGGFIPLGYSGGGGSSRPSKAAVAASPVEGRAGVSSSRMRCGDPEALLSPERYGRT